MSSHRASPILVGMLAAVLTLPAVGAVFSLTEPSRDLTLEFPDGVPVLVSRPNDDITAAALEGSDLSRVTATLDDRPWPLHVGGQTLRLSTRNMEPGGHLLEMGIVHAGRVRRTLAVPVIVGPFQEADAFVDRAVTVRIASEQIDDRDDTTDSDLAGAIRRLILTEAPQHEALGALRSCRVRIEPGRQPTQATLRGSAAFDGGSLDFTMVLQFERPEPRRIAIERFGPARVVLDERLLEHAREEGQRLGRQEGGRLGERWGSRISEEWGARVGRALGEFLGEQVGVEQAATEAERQVAQSIQQMADRFLPDLAAAVVLPNAVSLAPHLPGTHLELRFHEAPHFDSTGAFILALDGRVVGPQRLESHIPRWDAREASDVEGTSLSVSPGLLAQLLAAYSVQRLERDLAEGLRGEEPDGLELGPLRIESLHPESPAVLHSSSESDYGWMVPQVRVETNLDLDVRVVVQGRLDVELSNQPSLLVRPVVTDLGVACRDAHGRMSPCLTDAQSLVPDLPAQISSRLPAVSLFENAFQAFGDFTTASEAALRIRFEPREATTEQGPLVLRGAVSF